MAIRHLALGPFNNDQLKGFGWFVHISLVLC